MHLTNFINVLATKMIAHVIKQHCALRIARSERISFTCWPLGGCSPRLKPERQFTRGVNEAVLTPVMYVCGIDVKAAETAAAATRVKRRGQIRRLISLVAVFFGTF
jgi:hypothetical protein